MTHGDEFDQVVRQFGSALATISDGALSEDAVNLVVFADLVDP
jgi:hypothetical protein